MSMELRSSNYLPPGQYSVKYLDIRLVQVGVVVRESNGHTVGRTDPRRLRD